MTEKEQNFLTLYPIHRSLLTKAEQFLSEHKCLTTGKGNTMFVDSTFGKIIYNSDLSSVCVSYPLYSAKYKEEFKKQLLRDYSEQFYVQIIEEKSQKKGIFGIQEPCNLIVQIDCEQNKLHYLRLSVLEKQRLLGEAVSTLKNGLVELEDEKAVNRKK